MSCPIFTISNQKGGVGKTTTAINLSAALAAENLPTLVVDMDPQGNATSSLGIEKEEGVSLYDPIMDEGKAADVVRKTPIDNLSIIPSEVNLAVVETELGRMDNYLTLLRTCLAPLKKSGRYKAIILDCPPSLGMLSMNGLAAADFLLITLQCEYLALEGLTQILQVMEQIKTAGANKKLELGGIIMTMFDSRTKISKQIVNDVISHFKKQTFKTVIPRSIRLSEAPSFGQTIFEYDNHSAGAKAYRSLSREVIKRFKLK